MVGQHPTQSPVTAVSDVSTEDLLVRPVGANWTSYNGDYSGRRFSNLQEINVTNTRTTPRGVGFSPGQHAESRSVTPAVVRGVMYVTSSNDVFALDARSGRVVWHHQRPLSSGLLDDAAAHKNRGVAVWDHFVYTETDDAHLLCLDARSGSVLWDVQYADKAKHYGATSAPLVVKGAVIVGTSGGDSGVRGFVAAYDATVTGKLKWRLWTIPGPGEFGASSWPGDSYLHGGGTTWMPGTYDPELDTLYWTTSNAAPDFVGDSRPGDDLSTLPVSWQSTPDTGKLKWYFQFTPHDLYDFDANETPVLVDVEAKRTPPAGF
jgi:alcohol dehydrogenase (cytochrome c)